MEIARRHLLAIRESTLRSVQRTPAQDVNSRRASSRHFRPLNKEAEASKKSGAQAGDMMEFHSALPHPSENYLPVLPR